LRKESDQPIASLETRATGTGYLPKGRALMKEDEPGQGGAKGDKGDKGDVKTGGPGPKGGRAI
jgi:hypothetical protein